MHSSIIKATYNHEHDCQLLIITKVNTNSPGDFLFRLTLDQSQINFATACSSQRQCNGFKIKKMVIAEV